MRQCYPIAVPDCVSQVTINAPSGVIAALYSRPGGEARASAVFLPGFSGSKEDFIPMLAALSAGGYRVVAYDQAGQYESGGPSQPAGYSMQLFTDDLLAVIKKVGEGRRVHVLGHSFGGLVARRAVIVAPSLVRSLTLLDSGPDGASLKRRRLLGPLAWLIRLGGPKVVAGLMIRVLTNAGVPPGRMPWLRHRLLQTNRANLIGICRLLAREPNLAHELADTSVPLLVVCGNADDGWPAQTQADMARRLSAQAVVIEDAGHTPNEDQPVATAEALLHFWRGVDAATR